MLNGKLIHPEILSQLAQSGHGSKVLIADGNYPFKTKCGPRTAVVYLNLAPGLVSVTQVLASLVSATPFEAAEVMIPQDGPDPEIFKEFSAALPGVPIHRHGRFEFYEAAMDAHVTVAIATGDQRLFANLLLTVGVVAP
jgi:L-fucose mutarotase